MLELAQRQVDADCQRTLRPQPPGALGRTAAEVEDSQPADVTEDPDLLLVQAFRAPHETRVAQELPVLVLIAVRLGVPVGAVRPLGLRVVDVAEISGHVGNSRTFVTPRS